MNLKLQVTGVFQNKSLLYHDVALQRSCPFPSMLSNFQVDSERPPHSKLSRSQRRTAMNRPTVT